jgi:hypothetical protein
VLNRLITRFFSERSSDCCTYTTAKYKLTFPIGPAIDSDRSDETFLWASEPPYCKAMWSPISTYIS